MDFSSFLLIKDWQAHESVHEVLQSYLQNALSASLSSSFAEALDSYTCFYSLLELHINFENSLVLPLYEQKVPPEKRDGFARPEYYVEDHEKLLKQVRAVFIELLLPLNHQALIRALTDILDLLEHHDVREMEALYQTLFEYLDSPAQTELLEEFFKTHHTWTPPGKLPETLLLTAPLRNQFLEFWEEALQGKPVRGPWENFLGALGELEKAQNSPVLTKLLHLKGAGTVTDSEKLNYPALLALKQVDSLLRSYLKMELKKCIPPLT